MVMADQVGLLVSSAVGSLGLLMVVVSSVVGMLAASLSGGLAESGHGLERGPYLWTVTSFPSN